MVRLHGTCVAVSGLGVLLRGPPGSGKSDLALRLIDGGARLVADDQVELREEQGVVMASAPARLAGFIEVRGVGIVPVPSVAEAPLALVLDLVGAGAVERLPEIESAPLLGVFLPRFPLNPFEVSAAAKVRVAVDAARKNRLGRDPDFPLALPPDDADFR